MKFTLTKEISRLTVGIIVSLVVIVVLSMPLGVIPPLGNLLSPNTGIWGSAIDIDQSGTRIVIVDGIDDEITIIYDEWGIPHIFTETDKDMYFALGYVQARDRLFQLEFTRRLFTGRLSEILGSDFLEVDKYFRTLCFERSANATWQYIISHQPENQYFIDSIEAYTEGINYYVDKLPANRLPIEFRLINFKPSHWKPVYTLGFGKFMAYGLAFDKGYELLLIEVYDHFGKDIAEQLYPINNTIGMIPVLPNYGSYPSPPVGPNSTTSQQATDQIIIPKGLVSTAQAILKTTEEVLNKRIPIFGVTLREYVDSIGQSIGSNNWVVDGNITDTGYPILANDMHLAHSHPPIWYEVQHYSKESGINNYGFSFIGAPGIIAGHNQYAAWAFTNVGADVTDYYYYKTDDSGKKYWNATLGDWQSFKVITEEIPVKGEKPYLFNISFTGHGPIITPDLHGFNLDDQYIPLAVRWVGHDDLMRGQPDFLFKAVMNYRQAKNLDDFVEAGKDWDIPGQNLAIATIDGDIAIRPVARYPIRPKGQWGRIPTNGSSGENEWLGYIPYEELAVCHNPDQHFLASTNQKTAGPDYKYFMGSFFAPGYRNRRITQLIENKISSDEKISVEDMQRFQGDNVDTSVEAFKHVWSNIDPKGNSTLQEAIDILNSWHGKELGDMDRNLVAPTIFSVWLDKFYDNTFYDEFKELERYHYPQLNVLENFTLFNESVQWFDDVTTTDIETIDDVAYQSLIDALDYLTNYFGSSDFDEWIYGNYHQLYINHQLGFPSFSSGPYPWDGSGLTLNAAGGTKVRHGPSERAVYDLDPSKRLVTHAWTSIPGGQSGNPFSKHYRDQLEDLYIVRSNDGRYGYHPAHYYQSVDEFKQQASIDTTDDFTIELIIIIRPGGQ